MTETFWKIIATIGGTYTAPDAHDNLPAGIEVATELAKDPWCPEPARERLLEWLREANRVLSALRTTSPKPEE